MHPDSTLRSGAGHRLSNGSAFNALKHGFYAESIVLPGEDAAAFRRDRRALFHNHRPQTQQEADLVDMMAEHRWVLQRYRAVQARFDAQAIAPFTDAAGRIAEPDAHRRLHSGMDVLVHRQRVERMGYRAHAKLLEVQKQRRQGLTAGAVALPKDCYMETDGRVFGPVAQQVIVPIPEPDIEDGGADRDPPADSGALPASTDGGKGKYWEQQETGRAAEASRTAGARGTGRFEAPGRFAEGPGTAATGL